MSLYRLALGLLPADFRARYARGLLDAYRLELAERRSPLSRLRFRVRALADLAGTALRLRLDPPRARGEPDDAGFTTERGGMMETWAYDTRMAIRALRRSPGFTVIAVLTLALGIGANAAIFGVVNGVVLAPLPYEDSDELVMIWSEWVGFPKTWVSDGEYRTYANRSRTLASVGAWSGTSVTFTDPESPERVGAAALTEPVLETLGVEPILGRTFTPEEHETSADVVLLGHRLWQRRFGGDPSVVGRTVEINGTLSQVVGVLPAGFRLPTDFGPGDESEVYGPFSIDMDPSIPVPQSGGSHGRYVVARLAPGATVDQARTELSGFVDELAAEGVYSPEMAFRVQVHDVHADILGPARPALGVLLGAVALVLLIACGNVANLVLARSRGRAREIALRAAVGAPRGRVVRQLLLEHAALALAGGVAGLALARVGVGAILALDPGSVPRSDAVGMSGPVLLYTLGITAVTALLFGLVPALRTASGSPGGLLREGQRETGDRANRRGQSLLVAGQTALAVTLLVGAGLLLRTFHGLTAIEPGFETDDVLTMRVSLPTSQYPEIASVSAFFDGVLRDVRALPGVERAAFARMLPLASEIGDWGLWVEGYTPGPGEYMGGDWQVVTEGYVETMGIPVLQGRTFTLQDGDGSDELLINQAFADRYLGGRTAIGSRVAAMGDTAVVVGVVGNVTHNGITGEIKPKFYRLQRQIPDNLSGTARSMTLVAQVRGSPYSALDPVRQVIRRADPTLAVSQVQTLDEVMQRALGQPRLLVTLLGAFAGLALVLSVVGVYGVLAYTVSLRTREIGVRMALGAERGRVVRMVVRQGMAMALSGLAVGLLVAAWLGGFLDGLLYGVASRDPMTFVAVAVVFSVVALTAAYLPARRAAGTQPVEALRAE